MSVEVMMEYEMYKYESMKKYNLREQLMHLIFYNDNFEREDLSKYFKALNLDEEILRIPILIQIENSEVYMTKVKKFWMGINSVPDRILEILQKRTLFFFLRELAVILETSCRTTNIWSVNTCHLFFNISGRVIWFITFTWGPYKMISCIIVRLIWIVCGCRKIWGTARTEAFIFMII